VTDLPGQKQPGFDLGSELRRLNEAKAVGRGPRPSWRFWGLVLWAVLATAIAVAALGEPGPARRAGLEPAGVPAGAPAARPSLPDSPVQAAEPPWTVTFRNFAYFETAALLQLALIHQERERLAATGCPPPAGPAEEDKRVDPQWVGLPPAPEILLLDPLPETEAEFAAELEAAKAPTPPRPDPWPETDLFFQPPSPSAEPRPAYPEFLEDVFDPEAPAE